MRPEPVVRHAPLPERPEIQQIVLPTPWDVGPVQVYLIDAEPLTLVDTGVRNPESRAALAAALEELGYGFEDLRRVLLTHFHGDHLGQAETLRRAAPGLEVWCHEDEAEMCENFSAERDENVEGTDRLFRDFGVPEELRGRQRAQREQWVRQDPLCDATRIDRRLRGGEAVPFKGFSLQVIHAPGHTAGHCLYHEPDSGALFTGDHLMGNAVPYTDNYLLPGAPDPRDRLRRPPRFQGLPLYLAGLRALRRQRFRMLLPAHGGVLDRPGQTIDEALLFYEVRIQRIERALHAAAAGSGWASAWQVWERLFPKADPVSGMRTRMYMVIGALDGLEAEGRVETRWNAAGFLEHRPVGAARRSAGGGQEMDREVAALGVG
jgi:glyoxylase-like metal-dependent hydrolase (beta-lactamase superfamily II)